MRERLKLWKILLLSVSSAFLLGSCGGSSGSTENLKEISGVALDGYLENAHVCFDENDNRRCDNGEPDARTDRNGKFSLKISAEEFGKHKIIVEAIGNETKDNGEEVRDNFTLVSPPPDEDNVVVSPLTTIVARVMDRVNCDNCNKKDVAAEVVSKLVGSKVGTEEWLKDYGNEDTLNTLQDLARKIVEIISNFQEREVDFDTIIDFIVSRLSEIYLISNASISDLNTDTLDKNNVEKEISGISILLGNTFYNFVIDYSEEKGINWVSLRKASFGDGISNKEVKFYRFDVDNSETKNLDIVIDSIDGINWPSNPYYSYSLEVNEVNEEIELRDKDKNSFRIVAVSKASLQGKTLDTSFIFPDDLKRELEELGLENFNVTFDSGTMYILTLVTGDGYVKTMYTFDENAANQILANLAGWNNPSVKTSLRGTYQ